MKWKFLFIGLWKKIILYRVAHFYGLSNFCIVFLEPLNELMIQNFRNMYSFYVYNGKGCVPLQVEKNTHCKNPILIINSTLTKIHR